MRPGRNRFQRTSLGGGLAVRTQVRPWHALCVVLRMVVYAIMPRRRSYWIEAVEDGGERRAIGCFPNEEAAVRRLHELQERQEAKERRRVAQEMSRWNAAHAALFGEDGHDSR